MVRLGEVPFIVSDAAPGQEIHDYPERILWRWLQLIVRR